MSASMKRQGSAVGSFPYFGRFALVAAATWSGLTADLAHAGPVQGNASHGQVTFEQYANKTIIRASDGSIINYLNFNIGSGQTVKFIQPGDFARVLNRVTGNDPSVISGTLRANGQVYLVNPAGVFFTNGAVVNVGGLWAAGGNLTDAHFLDGVDKFTNLDGAVINDGMIRAGQAHLVGQNVANSGQIKVPRGIITMVAGDQVVISQHGEKVSVKVDGTRLTNRAKPQHGWTTPDMTGGPGVDNSGEITSKKGQIFLGAGDVYSLAVRNSGKIESEKGEITLAGKDGLIHNTESGTIRANAASGTAGDVVVQAPSIVNDGRISADATKGRAGYVEVTSQSHTFLTDGSEVSAAGGSQKAHGGEILVHSYNGNTILSTDGHVDVSGGKKGGHGGFAEVSGEILGFNGSANLNAAAGYDKGTLLLDPHNITITNKGCDDSFLNDNIIFFNEPNTTKNITISAAALEALVGDIMLQATGSIHVNKSVHFVHDNNVTFWANKNIGINSPMTGMNDFTAFADFDGNGKGDLFIHHPLGIAGNGYFDGHTTFLNSGVLATGGQQFYFGPVDLCVDMTLAGEAVRFFSRVDATDPGVQSLTIRGPFEGGGNNGGGEITDGYAQFDGPAGGSRKLEFLRVHGESAINGGEITTQDFQEYLGDATIGNDAVLTSTNAGDVRFAERLDASYGGKGKAGAIGPMFNLLVQTAGKTLFQGVTGGLQALQSLTTDGPGNTEIGGDMTTQVIDFNDPVKLQNTVAINAAESIEFSQLLDGNFHSLAVNSPLTTFTGQAYKLDLLQTDADGQTFVNANIAGNRLNFLDPVSVTADAWFTGLRWINFNQTLDGPYNVTTFSERQIRFGGDVGGNKALASLTTSVGPRDLVNRNLVLIDGNLIKATGNVTFELDSRERPARVATLAARHADGVLIQSVNGDVFMGNNEKLTGLGDVTIRAQNGAATLGDVNSGGNLKVDAGAIRVWARGEGSLAEFQGNRIKDPEVDFVAMGSINFSTAPELLGDGLPPVFSTRSGGGIAAAADGFEHRRWADLSDANFTLGGLVLDLQPPHIPPTPPPPVDTPRDGLATALPGPTRIADRVPRDPFAIREMNQLAINLRGPRGDEETASGRELLSDLAKPGTDPASLTVASNRLRRESVLKSLEMYASLFEAVEEAQGDEAISQDHTQAIRNAIDSAWKQFKAANGEQADPAELRAFLAADEAHAEALAYVDALRNLVRELWIMGVTKLELRVSLNKVLAPVTPGGMKQVELERALGVDMLNGH